MYQIKTDTSALPWSPTGWPGVSMKMLQQVESTGGMTGMMRMEAGSFDPGTQPHKRRPNGLRGRRGPRRSRRELRAGQLLRRQGGLAARPARLVGRLRPAVLVFRPAGLRPRRVGGSAAA